MADFLNWQLEEDPLIPLSPQRRQTVQQQGLLGMAMGLLEANRFRPASQPAPSVGSALLSGANNIFALQRQAEQDQLKRLYTKSAIGSADSLAKYRDAKIAEEERKRKGIEAWQSWIREQGTGDVPAGTTTPSVTPSPTPPPTGSPEQTGSTDPAAPLGALVKYTIQRESGGNPNAVSETGNVGLMQLGPDVIKNYNVADPRDPTQNVNAGTAYLVDMAKKYKDHPNGPQLALMAYHAGETNVDKFVMGQPNGVGPKTKAYASDPQALQLMTSYVDTLRGGQAPATPVQAFNAQARAKMPGVQPASMLASRAALRKGVELGALDAGEAMRLEQQMITNQEQAERNRLLNEESVWRSKKHAEELAEADRRKTARSKLIGQRYDPGTGRTFRGSDSDPGGLGMPRVQAPTATGVPFDQLNRQQQGARLYEEGLLKTEKYVDTQKPDSENYVSIRHKKTGEASYVPRQEAARLAAPGGDWTIYEKPEIKSHKGTFFTVDPVLGKFTDVRTFKDEGIETLAGHNVRLNETIETPDVTLPKGMSVTAAQVVRDGKTQPEWIVSVRRGPDSEETMNVKVPSASIQMVTQQDAPGLITKSDLSKQKLETDTLKGNVADVTKLLDLVAEGNVPAGTTSKIVGAVQNFWDQFDQIKDEYSGGGDLYDTAVRIRDSAVNRLDREIKQELDVDKRTMLREYQNNLRRPDLPVAQVMKEAIAVGLAGSRFPDQRIPIEALNRAREDVDVLGWTAGGRRIATKKLERIRDELRRALEQRMTNLRESEAPEMIYKNRSRSDPRLPDHDPYGIR